MMCYSGIDLPGTQVRLLQNVASHGACASSCLSTAVCTFSSYDSGNKACSLRNSLLLSTSVGTNSVAASTNTVCFYAPGMRRKEGGKCGMVRAGRGGAQGMGPLIGDVQVDVQVEKGTMRLVGHGWSRDPQAAGGPITPMC